VRFDVKRGPDIGRSKKKTFRPSDEILAATHSPLPRLHCALPSLVATVAKMSDKKTKRERDPSSDKNSSKESSNIEEEGPLNELVFEDPFEDQFEEEEEVEEEKDVYDEEDDEVYEEGGGGASARKNLGETYTTTD
jgi:hypothetical protein